MPSNHSFTNKFISENLMGPNVVIMFDELCGNKLPMEAEARICDLGCGTGLSSLAIASTTNGTVYAVDSWNAPEQNRERFDMFDFGKRIVAVQAGAPILPFQESFFDALVCLDSYNYFGREVGVIDKVAAYTKPGGKVYLGISGVKRELTDADMEVFGLSWTPEQMAYIRTPRYWKQLLGKSDAMRIDRIFEMACHESAWNDWLSCDNEYAIGDRAACRAGAIDLMCTVGVEMTVVR